MVIKKGDFIEILFTGRVKGGEIFDSNIKEDLKNTALEEKAKPFIFSIGKEMFVKGVDNFLIGKEIGEYNISVKPEEAFGKRNPKLIQLVPIKVFIQNKLNPLPGVVFNFDGKIAKVLTVSGGRVMVDFNNPVAGKDLEYKIIVKRIISDLKEKVASINDFFFRRNFDFELKDNLIIFKVPKEIKPILELFKEKYKELLEMDLEIETIEENKK